jgi:ferredoxin
MLSPIEKILFIIFTLASLYFTYKGAMRIIAYISSGQGRPNWNLIWKRIGELIMKVGLFQPVFRFRLGPSILHAFIGWGLFVFLLVDLSELLYGMFEFRLLEQGGILGDIYRLTADIANTAILVGIVALVIRRFILRPRNLSTRESTLLHPVAFWLSLGAIVAFLPYFPYSKHIHLFFAPINFALKPERKSIGELGYLNMDDEKIEQFGAAKVATWATSRCGRYACIMCFRCQEVCPAYNTGKILSPAALEINKRYNFNLGGGVDKPMIDLIPEEAIWACTSCGACVDICPVGNEPMRDILDIRRNLALMESKRAQATGIGLQGHGTQRQPLERLARRPHEVG